jgi:hypothetical protein
VRHMQATASELAGRISEHLAVEVVHHPSLPSPDASALVGEGRQMSGPGSMLSFELRGGFAAARTVLSELRLMSHAVSLGSTDTLAQHPASLTHRVVDESGRESGGVHQSLVRISVGLENVEDLWADLSQALDCALLVEPAPSSTHPEHGSDRATASWPPKATFQGFTTSFTARTPTGPGRSCNPRQQSDPAPLR